MSKPPESIYVRIALVDGQQITVLSTHPGDFREIGDPPLKIDAIEIVGRGRSEETKGDLINSKEYKMIFTARTGQNLKILQLHKRYKLTYF
jgi:hypothetical protein